MPAIPFSVYLVIPLVGYAIYRLRSKGPGKFVVKTTQLRGPPSEGFLFGNKQLVTEKHKSKILLQPWLEEYGGVFAVPAPLGSSTVYIADPKAASHVLAHSKNIYHINPIVQTITENLVGKGLISSDGDSHARQRKFISPGFTSVKMREYNSTFFDMAHQVEHYWNVHLQKDDQYYVTDVQHWFTSYALDTVGLACFSRDFGAIHGRHSEIQAAFEDVGVAGIKLIDIMTFVIPPLGKLPSQRNRATKRLQDAADVIARDLMEKATIEDREEKSIMGLMLRAASSDHVSSMSQEEVACQIKTVIVAGGETTSTTLTWALIELCRNFDLQERVRNEIVSKFPMEDPTYDEVTNGLPLLDALVHETLRTHPALEDALRIARCDDVVPLSKPVVLPNGQVTDSIVIAKDQAVNLSIEILNLSREVWGEDAGEFKPERWLSELPEQVRAIPTYRHLFTFLDGPKICLGRSFAVINIKAILVVLLRKFTFELPGGPESKIDIMRRITPRPKDIDADGPIVRMKIRAVE